MAVSPSPLARYTRSSLFAKEFFCFFFTYAPFPMGSVTLRTRKWIIVVIRHFEISDASAVSARAIKWSLLFVGNYLARLCICNDILFSHNSPLLRSVNA